jgi:hypothetical protein
VEMEGPHGSGQGIEPDGDTLRHGERIPGWGGWPKGDPGVGEWRGCNLKRYPREKPEEWGQRIDCRPTDLPARTRPRREV